MKESYGKDPTSHPDPESCAGDRKGAGEALTGAHVGQPSSCEIRSSGVPTLLTYVAQVVADFTPKRLPRSRISWFFRSEDRLRSL